MEHEAAHRSKKQAQPGAAKSRTAKAAERAPSRLADRVLGLQAAAGNSAVGRLVGGAGLPLDPRTRVEMETRLGHDLSSVRVHADAGAVRLARTESALAFTSGRNVYFGAGAYAPRTRAGRALLAHELAHVIQQLPGSRASRGATAKLETEAQRAAATTGPALVTPGSVRPGTIQRADKEVPLRPSPEHGTFGGGKPPVPEVGQTPFSFVSESPALGNYEEAVRRTASRFFGKDFKTYDEAVAHYRNRLATLPPEERPDFARRIFDRLRKAFYRREAKSPSFKYTPEQLARLKRGAAPTATFQLEHLTDIKHAPEQALSRELWYTQGGPGGTQPTGTPHQQKGERIPKSWKGAGPKAAPSTSETPTVKPETPPTAAEMPTVKAAGTPPSGTPPAAPQPQTPPPAAVPEKAAAAPKVAPEKVPGPKVSPETKTPGAAPTELHGGLGGVKGGFKGAPGGGGALERWAGAGETLNQGLFAVQVLSAVSRTLDEWRMGQQLESEFIWLPGRTSKLEADVNRLRDANPKATIYANISFRFKWGIPPQVAEGVPLGFATQVFREAKFVDVQTSTVPLNMVSSSIQDEVAYLKQQRTDLVTYSVPLARPGERWDPSMEFVPSKAGVKPMRRVMFEFGAMDPEFGEEMEMQAEELDPQTRRKQAEEPSP